MVPNGGNAVYPGDEPVKEGEYAFKGWKPEPTNVTADMDCYAQFKSTVVVVEVAEITDSWDEILASISDGTYVDKYNIGNYKPLDLGSEGVVNMQIVAFDADELADNSGTAAISWLSIELLALSRRMNLYRSGNSGSYKEGTGAIGGWEKSEMRAHFKSTVKNCIPENVRSGIKEVIKSVNFYNTAGTVEKSHIVDDVWLPSYRELTGYISCEADGPVYAPLYTEASTDTLKKRRPDVSGSDGQAWWTRSAVSSEGFYFVSVAGTIGGTYSTNIYGAPLGFCT